jgi:aminoglycoside 3-N-acetyltransferase
VPGKAYVTRESLVADLRKLGVRTGQSILLHASLRSLGWVEGAAPAVVAALSEAIGRGGTLIVPATTAANSTTSPAYRERTRGMTARQRRAYRRSMPPFDPASTPGTGTGAIAECLRTMAGAERSTHPQSSFAAIGARAGHYMSDHADDCHLGEDSPLAKLYEAGAWILMLGVGFDTCTAFHLAEYRYTDSPPRRRYACVVNGDAYPRWWQYEDVVLDDSDFRRIGEALEAMPVVIKGPVGSAEATWIPLRDAVDFAAAWMAAHRSVSTQPKPNR